MTNSERKDFAAECKRRRDEGLKVFGAYELRHKLKEAGGIWDSRLKAWLIPSHEVADDLGLVARTGRHGDFYVTRESGDRSRQKRKREIDAHGCSYCGSGTESGLTAKGEMLAYELGECPRCGMDFDS